MPGAGLGLQRLPMGNDAARLAAHVPQRPVTPDVAFRVLRMTLDGHRSELVVGPNASGATAERAVAARSLVWRNWKSQANCPAVAGTVEGWCGCRGGARHFPGAPKSLKGISLIVPRPASAAMICVGKQLKGVTANCALEPIEDDIGQCLRGKRRTNCHLLRKCWLRQVNPL